MGVGRGARTSSRFARWPCVRMRFWRVRLRLNSLMVVNGHISGTGPEEPSLNLSVISLKSSAVNFMNGIDHRLAIVSVSEKLVCKLTVESDSVWVIGHGCLCNACFLLFYPPTVTDTVYCDGTKA